MIEYSDKPLISVRDVSVSFKKGRSLFSPKNINVLNGLDFEIYPGDSLGVVGRNGAGKSTLLKLLAGIIAPDSGDIVLNCRNASLLALGVGFNADLSGRTNIAINSFLLGFSRKEVDEKVEKIIEYSGLANAIDDAVKTYSSGMRSRLAFSIAIHMQPDVLLIDEALGVGDAQFMEKSTASIHERIKSEQTVVLVSHQADTIKELCNRVLWIEGGTMKAIGDTEEVMAEYESYMTAAK